MDRDVARELLVVRMLASKRHAVSVRARLDSSQLGRHASLATLLADHDLHRPDAPAEGPARRASVTAWVLRLADQAASPEARSRGRATDPRWVLVAEAQASLRDLRDHEPGTAPLEELFAAFSERRAAGPDAPQVPGQPGPDRRRRRGDGWRG